LTAAAAGSPEIERLVLIGATAGIADDHQRAERVAADAALAAKVEEVGVEAFVDEWLAGPMFTRLPEDPEGRRQRLANRADGLASSLRLAGAGAQAPLWDRLRTVEVPVLVLAGADDHKFAAIGERLADALPNATHTLIDGAGHAAHLEQPERVADTIAGWLRHTADA
jgi:2-succinyl-6-hydroxy-2,4-cyclohexadiene-1-carboxylate synthase